MTSTSEQDPLEPLWQKAFEASYRADYPGVLYVWRALAEKGVWQLEARIGELYERGAVGIKKDTEQALHWYRRAIFHVDDPLAHCGLGRAYYTGVGANSDFAAALKHFQKAISNGRTEAGIYLGLMYYRAHGVERDVERAATYFRTAGEQGYPAAYAYLARIALGQGKWFAALSVFMKAVALGVKLVTKNAGDDRLLGIQGKK